MEQTINERFAKLIESHNMNPSSFSKSINKSYNAIESIVKGRTRPSYDVLEAVFTAYPGVSRDWLLMGDGQMLRKNEQQSQDIYLLEHLQTLEANFAQLASQLEKKDHQLDAKDQHIERLTKMLETFVGKPKGAIYGPLSDEEVEYQTRMQDYLRSVADQPFMQLFMQSNFLR